METKIWPSKHNDLHDHFFFVYIVFRKNFMENFHHSRNHLESNDHFVNCFLFFFFFDLTPKKIFMAVYVVIGFGFGLKDLNLSFFWAGLHPQQKIFFSVINNIRIQNTVCHVYVVFVVVVVSW